MSELLELAERCGKAEGPDRGLEADIELATGNWGQEHYDAWHWYQAAGESANPPLYEPVPPQPLTASVDAALTLIPPGYVYSLTNASRKPRANIWRPSALRDAPPPYVSAATSALAICAAALRARAA